MTSLTRKPWPLPSVFILLTIVPVVAGAHRIGELATGAQVTAQNARFFADPAPVVVHIIGATTFCILGGFQFSPYFRRRWPRWHRVAGRIVAPCGLATALSGMFMAVFYQEPADVGALLTGFRLVFGSAMAVSLVLGFVAILRRDVVTHRAWMIRGYAIGVGAGTQLLTEAPWILLVGPVDKLSNALLMLAGWLINVAVAEWVIRRSRPLRSRPHPAQWSWSRSSASPPPSVV